MSNNSKKLIAYNYFGSKFTMIDEMLPLFPKHYHFIDVFCGSLAVTLNKPKSKIDTANDINGNVINFFRVLRDQPEELITALALTPVSRQEFNESWHTLGLSDFERARRFYVRLRQSFSGLGAQRKNKGWHLAVQSSRTHYAETVSRWLNGCAKLPMIVERLKEIQFENRSYKDIIDVLDFEDAFFYCDPPYHREARGSFGDYEFEFSDELHNDLAHRLNNIKGKAMISGYDCPSMQKLYKGWYFHRFPIKGNNFRHQVVEECVWMNYEPPKNQPKLFL